MTSFALNHYPLYLLVLLRVVAFVATSPLMSIRLWPAWAKLGLAAFTALWIAPDLPSIHTPDPLADVGRYVDMALRETVTGMLLGLIATAVVAALTIAGQLFDLQIGFASGALLDPAGGQVSGVTGNLLSTLFSLYFLGLNGLDGLLLACMNSYRFVGLGALRLPDGAWAAWARLMDAVMALSVQVCAPLVAALLLTDVTFALLSRAVPQMNVFVVGLPAKLFVGLGLFVAVLPGVVDLFGSVFAHLFAELDESLRWLGG
ncbi:MAG: flagellar biosynthetic protein FliR [Alicyclobacillus macrosporangiidus]|uniref:flagellar biosynthetic protein FliR n=1 Tax=Alicyclobacillus macrosporangiidus TaxID=392015 RepID=UPI0026EABF1C|nr:flagellar biosynthetic protein FliR [Alicyclobacillus macrosporangiidus]MCL6597352.1 flagellar biosynthetic protein FliR [Alicyclobacillus macrosporangiidus]